MRSNSGVASAATYDVRAKQRLSVSNNSFKQSMSLESTDSTDERSVTTGAGRALTPLTLTAPQLLSAAPAPSDAYLYTRPVSPTYCNVKPRHHARSATVGSSATAATAIPSAYGNSAAVFRPTYYRKDSDPQQYALTKLSPPKRPRTLQYKPSLSSPAAPTAANPPIAYYSSDTNYYSPAEILISAATHQQQLQHQQRAKTLRKSMPASLAMTHDKRYATLSYPKESQRLKQLSRSVSEKNAAPLTPSSPFGTPLSDYEGGGEFIDDPLDCKIGCQTTLRSKPRIPWYELAIRKPATDRRRQSCPPTYEVCDDTRNATNGWGGVERGW